MSITKQNLYYIFGEYERNCKLWNCDVKLYTYFIAIILLILPTHVGRASVLCSLKIPLSFIMIFNTATMLLDTAEAEKPNTSTLMY